MDASTHRRARSRLSGEPSRPGPSGGEAGGGRTAPWFPEVSRGLQQREGPPEALTAGTGASTTLGGPGTSQVSGCWGGDGPDAVQRRCHRRVLSGQRRTRETEAALSWGGGSGSRERGQEAAPPAPSLPRARRQHGTVSSGQRVPALGGCRGQGRCSRHRGPPGRVTQPPPRPAATPLRAEGPVGQTRREAATRTAQVPAGRAETGAPRGRCSRALTAQAARGP